MVITASLFCIFRTIFTSCESRAVLSPHYQHCFTFSSTNGQSFSFVHFFKILFIIFSYVCPSVLLIYFSRLFCSEENIHHFWFIFIYQSILCVCMRSINCYLYPVYYTYYIVSVHVLINGLLHMLSVALHKCEITGGMEIPTDGASHLWAPFHPLDFFRHRLRTINCVQPLGIRVWFWLKTFEAVFQAAFVQFWGSRQAYGKGPSDRRRRTCRQMRHVTTHSARGSSSNRRWCIHVTESQATRRAQLPKSHSDLLSRVTCRLCVERRWSQISAGSPEVPLGDMKHQQLSAREPVSVRKAAAMLIHWVFLLFNDVAHYWPSKSLSSVRSGDTVLLTPAHFPLLYQWPPLRIRWRRIRSTSVALLARHFKHTEDAASPGIHCFHEVPGWHCVRD